MDRQHEPRSVRGESPRSGAAPLQRPIIDERVLDLDVIERLRALGGEDEPDLVLDLIQLFLFDAHQRLEEMRLALDRRDLDAVARTAHTLKSSSGSMGAVLLSEVCKEVEELARRCEGGELSTKAESCFEAYDQTESALKQIEE